MRALHGPLVRRGGLLSNRPSPGWVVPGRTPIQADRSAVHTALQRLDVPFCVALTPTGPGVVHGGRVELSGGPTPPGALPLLAWVPALTPDGLGDPTFATTYGCRVPYVAGAMANGIASVEIVVAMARAGMLGFFGAAGLSTERVEQAIDRVQDEAPGLPVGFNLIHSPSEPWQEQQTVDLFLRRGVRIVSTSAYLGLTPMVVQYRATGLRPRPDGTVAVRNRLLAKVSRPEVAEPFLRPAPAAMLAALVEQGRITAAEAELAARIPMADDLTAEADSGGHTDNRPLTVLLPLLQRLRDRVCAELHYDTPVRVGAAGGIGSPLAAAAALTAGAAYLVTGTINQACVEAGTSPMVKDLLATAGMADVGMAPASDMFEAGVDVQVLKRGTLFAMRGRQLYALYRDHDSLEALPPADAERLQRTVFKRSFDAVWADCERYFGEVDPAQLQRAEADAKHRMALVFRWYLGMSSRWAIAGDAERRTDAQVWCGPAIGAFNDWTEGTFLAEPANRGVVVVGANVMAGAAMHLRARSLRDQGVHLDGVHWLPRPIATASAVRAPLESHATA